MSDKELLLSALEAILQERIIDHSNPLFAEERVKIILLKIINLVDAYNSECNYDV